MRLPDLSLPRRAATIAVAVVALLTAGLLAWLTLGGGDEESAATPAAQDREPLNGGLPRRWLLRTCPRLT